MAGQFGRRTGTAVAMGVKFFEEYPSLVVPKKVFEKIHGEIWEIKAHYGKEQFRLYGFKDEGLAIAAVGVEKKWQKARNTNIELTEKRRKEHFARKKKRPPAP
jgi:hypothetical protein